MAFGFVFLARRDMSAIPRLMVWTASVPRSGNEVRTVPPARFMGSWNSLVERVRALSSEPRSPHDLGAEQLAFMSGMLDRAVDFRLAHPELEERWIDVNYYDLVEDPMGVIRAIHEHFGWTLEQAAVDSMTDWRFRQAVHRQRETRHRYSLEDYGLTVEAVNAAFARYREFLTSQGIRSLRK